MKQVQDMTTGKLLKSLHRAVDELEAPIDYFSGKCLYDHFCPDNLLLFRRTHSQDFRPEGVSNNYHHRFVLVVVLRKGGPVRVGDCSHILQPREAILIFPNQFHHFMDVEKGALEWIFITFELRHFKDIRSLRDNPRCLDDEALAFILEFVRLESRLRKQAEDSLLAMSHVLARFLLKMRTLPLLPDTRRNIHLSDDSRDLILERINTIVRENPDRTLSLDDLARETGYSASYLRAVFRDRLGISLGRYVRESRLSHAAQLLQSSNLTITDVSRHTGFESIQAFSRAFKKAFGLSPRSYSQIVEQRKKP